MIYQKPAFLGLIAYPGLIFWEKLPNHTMLPCISYGRISEKKEADHKMQNTFTSLIHMLQLHGQETR